MFSFTSLYHITPPYYSVLNTQHAFDIFAFSCDWFCRLNKLALLQFLLRLIFVMLFMFFSLCFPIKVFPRFSAYRTRFLEVFYLVIQQQLMLWWNTQTSAALFQCWRALHANLLKSHSVTGIFKEFLHKCRTAILKNATWWLLLRTTLFWIYFWMAPSQRQLQRYIVTVTHILHFLLWRHVKEERFFMDFF